MRIEMELHKEGNALVLNSQDIYNYISEETMAEVELALFVDKYCEYLNYYIDHNKEMAFGDTDFSRLEGWLDGYVFAKKYIISQKNGETHIKAGRYLIIFPKPFVI